jgi:hypothetical protein
MSAIDKLKYVIFSTFGKVIMLGLFIGFIYQPIVDICLFFGIDNSFVYMYSAWLIFLFLLLIILRTDNGIITYTKDLSGPVIQPIVSAPIISAPIVSAPAPAVAPK